MVIEVHHSVHPRRAGRTGLARCPLLVTAPSGAVGYARRLYLFGIVCAQRDFDHLKDLRGADVPWGAHSLGVKLGQNV